MLHANIEKVLNRGDLAIILMPCKGESSLEREVLLTNKAMKGDDVLFLVRRNLSLGM